MAKEWQQPGAQLGFVDPNRKYLVCLVVTVLAKRNLALIKWPSLGRGRDVYFLMLKLLKGKEEDDVNLHFIKASFPFSSRSM